MGEKLEILEINNMNNLKSKIDIIPNCRYVDEFILKKYKRKIDLANIQNKKGKQLKKKK